jgi:hypothetical protein
VGGYDGETWIQVDVEFPNDLQFVHLQLILDKKILSQHALLWVALSGSEPP